MPPVVVIGAGPVGLSAAVQLLGRNVDVVVVEAADDVAASVRDWGHVRLFSPWRYNVDRTAVRPLEATGWTPPPPDDLPTGNELHRDYLGPLATLPQVRARLRLGHRVRAITRQGLDKTRTDGRGDAPFVVHTDGGDLLARAVIDATGTWGTNVIVEWYGRATFGTRQGRLAAVTGTARAMSPFVVEAGHRFASYAVVFGALAGVLALGAWTCASAARARARELLRTAPCSR